MIVIEAKARNTTWNKRYSYFQVVRLSAVKISIEPSKSSNVQRPTKWINTLKESRTSSSTFFNDHCHNDRNRSAKARRSLVVESKLFTVSQIQQAIVETQGLKPIGLGLLVNEGWILKHSNLRRSKKDFITKEVSEWAKKRKIDLDSDQCYECETSNHYIAQCLKVICFCCNCKGHEHQVSLKSKSKVTYVLVLLDTSREKSKNHLFGQMLGPLKLERVRPCPSEYQKTRGDEIRGWHQTKTIGNSTAKCKLIESYRA